MPDDFDLSALDPSRDSAFEARVTRVASDAMDAREQLRAAARAEPSGIVSALTSWTRPTVLAAGILLAIALGILVRTQGAAPVAPVSSSDALGLPGPLLDILHSTRQPSLVELDVALAAVRSR
jgi:acyl-CoA reductase-like NAD-dependent aldehyde dehydrogenase